MDTNPIPIGDSPVLQPVLEFALDLAGFSVSEVQGRCNAFLH
jgi:hypothetical protein